MKRKTIQLITILIFIFVLLSCSNNSHDDVVVDVEFSFYNWYDTSSKTKITLTGNIKKRTDYEEGEGNYLDSYSKFYAYGDIYYNNEKLKYVESNDKKFEDLYFYNNNYFYVKKLGNNQYYFNATVNEIYIKEYKMLYGFPLLYNKLYARWNINEIFEDYSYDYLREYYSNFTDYVNIDNINKCIEITSDELDYSGFENRTITTTFDFVNRIVSVKSDNIDIVL